MEKAHKKLKVWNESISLAKEIYRITDTLPDSERYGLSAQMRRAAVSIPCNIAEGAARRGDRDSLQFYIIARASLSELDTQVELCLELGFLIPSDVSPLTSHLDTVDSLLSGLIRYKCKRCLKTNDSRA